MTKSIIAFNQCAEQYDQWFDEHAVIFHSELKALKQCVPKIGLGLEIGVGTGRFAVELGAHHGIEPAPAMRAMALSRGIHALNGTAESLPYQDNYFDFALLITTLCFISDPEKAFQEVHRVLKPHGTIIIGMIDRDSNLGQSYEKNKQNNPFYRYARFFSVNEVSELLHRTGFRVTNIVQTLFSPLKEIQVIEPVKKGHGRGSFVVISAELLR